MKKVSGSLETSDRQQIFYNHYKNSNKAVAVIAHGFFNSKDSELIKKTANELIKFIDIITFDFRGHGQSQGLFYWTSKEHLDLEAVLSFASQSYKKIGLIGFSLGAATSIITLSRVSCVDSFICVSGPTEFEKIDYRFWELDIDNDIIYNLGEGRKGKGVRPGPFWLKKDKPVALIKKLKIPILYLHGEADWVILPWHSELLYKKTMSKKHIVIFKKGHHAEYLMRTNGREFVQEIKNWFEQTLYEKQVIL